MSDDSDWAPPEASAADWAPPEAQDDADRESFRSKVGRDPASLTELKVFKAHPELVAGYQDPNRAPVSASDLPGGLATAATGMLASIPGGIRQYRA